MKFPLSKGDRICHTGIRACGIRIFFFIFVWTSFPEARSQTSEVGNWFMYVGSQPLGKRTILWNEVQLRSYNALGDLEQLVLRAGLGWNLSESNNNLLLGYAFIHSEPYIAGTDRKRKIDEHRLFQQFITRQRFGRTYIQHRYRIEERFLPEDFRLRFRYFLSVNLPLNLKALDKGAWYLSAYNEIFLHADGPVFDRDRLYGALGYVIRKDLRLEAGWMSQIQERKSRGQFQLVLFNSLPFRKRPV
jgi:hypothetical protein